MSQLPADCLNEIFEYLEEDKATLYSCLLVNRLWCDLSVRILWRDSWDYNIQTCSTLFACLSNESKDVLLKNGIIIKTSTSKPPMFNYPVFCKVLSVYNVDIVIKQFISSQNDNDSGYDNFVKQEIYKLFMNQTSLKNLAFRYSSQVDFISYPGAEGCLKNLSALHCNSAICSDFFYQLSQICHTIQSLSITFQEVVSNGLTDLISVQRNLKYFFGDCGTPKNVIPSLTKLPDTLIKLNLCGGYHRISLSFIAKFVNLQELELSFDYDYCFDNFEKLQHITFSQLQILNIRCAYPICELLIRFLENSGKNLKEFYVSEEIGNSDNSLNLAIAMFCPNLRKLSTGFKRDELETLKIVFNSCQYLKSIKIWCGGDYLSEKEALETIVKYSPKNICELILYSIHNIRSELLPEELESILLSWKNSVPQKLPLSLIVIVNYYTNISFASLDTNGENMKIIEKYIKLGVIKTFKVDYEFD